ncbi:MAG: spiro-SPASM protein [Spirochaetota bacterium]
MNIFAVLYCDDNFSDEYISFAGKSSFSFIESSLKDISEISGIVISVPSEYSGALTGQKNTIVRSADDIGAWKEIAAATGADHFIRIFADAPFIDALIINEMLSIHLKYCAEFTYSENLPSGLSCEIISGELIRSLPEADEKRLSLSKVIKSNINQFDVELYYKDPDIRDKRIAFRCSDPRDKRIMEELFSRSGSVPPYEKLRSLIEEHCDILHAGPSWCEIELTGRADVTSLYSCRTAIKEPRGDMDPALFKKIISEMNSFNLPYAVCLGGAGDPLLHGAFYECLDFVKKEKSASAIFIETDGICIDERFRAYLENDNDPRIKLIIDMSGYSRESYQAMHGADSFDRIQGNIRGLQSILGEKSDRMFVQLMKIKETEPFIDAYYDYWESQKVQIILQKQNIFLGAVQDRRYYDLTPLDRVPCWHLQRDLFILADGRAGFCKQDINGDWARGNCGQESLGDIWMRGKQSFMNDYKKHLSVNPDCASCDEWYTFNM